MLNQSIHAMHNADNSLKIIQSAQKVNHEQQKLSR